MNGTASKIEIIAPFKAAFEWMKAMLFRPFDVAKWLTIAFAAFIGGNAGSGGGNFRGLSRLGDGDWKYRATTHGDFADWNLAPWFIAGIVAIVLVATVLAVVWMWVSSRGKFIFTDCIVKNRGAIGEPWREYRREGNSYFLFSLAVAAAMIVLVLVMLGVILLPFGVFSDDGPTGGAKAALVVILILFGLLWIAIVIAFALITHFMVPVMYRRRCSAREAFVDVAKLIAANPGPFILFVLFMIALAIGVAIVAAMVACATCCVGALPYISTVLLLPAIVWLAAYRLLFIRQFGDQYDVWATTATPPTTLPPATAAPA